MTYSAHNRLASSNQRLEKLRRKVSWGIQCCVATERIYLLFLLCAAKGHDDVVKWKHCPRHWPFVRGIHRSPVNSPHKGQWRGAVMFSLICAWINGWVNNSEAGDLRCHGFHYYATVMWYHNNEVHDISMKYRLICQIAGFGPQRIHCCIKHIC